MIKPKYELEIGCTVLIRINANCKDEKAMKASINKITDLGT